MQSPETRCAHSWDGFKLLLAFEDRYRSYVVVLGGPRLPLSPSGTFTGHSGWMQVTHTLAGAFFNFLFFQCFQKKIIFIFFKVYNLPKHFLAGVTGQNGGRMEANMAISKTYRYHNDARYRVSRSYQNSGICWHRGSMRTVARRCLRLIVTPVSPWMTRNGALRPSMAWHLSAC
ncbi:hypothetical protein LY76DRAFT_25507 [Colletotrichum caudatum]|nr:hypothetical protein LY76DRAFT_25507 [Colletotrichum caudatum]